MRRNEFLNVKYFLTFCLTKHSFVSSSNDLSTNSYNRAKNLSDGLKIVVNN